jgi:hypothetical protein
MWAKWLRSAQLEWIMKHCNIKCTQTDIIQMLTCLFKNLNLNENATIITIGQWMFYMASQTIQSKLKHKHNRLQYWYLLPVQLTNMRQNEQHNVL